ncbi:unnamed protein product [Arctogadus glacialis]
MIYSFKEALQCLIIRDISVWSKVKMSNKVINELCLCPGLQCTMNEERGAGGPTSETTLSGDHGHQSKAKRRVQQEPPESPGPSRVSMEKDCSITRPVGFNEGQPFVEGKPFMKRVKQERAGSPGPSCVSLNTDDSRIHPLQCKEEAHSPGEERLFVPTAHEKMS